MSTTTEKEQAAAPQKTAVQTGKKKSSRRKAAAPTEKKDALSTAKAIGQGAVKTVVELVQATGYGGELAVKAFRHGAGMKG
jgi:hypothetical protein